MDGQKECWIVGVAVAVVVAAAVAVAAVGVVEVRGGRECSRRAWTMVLDVGGWAAVRNLANTTFNTNPCKLLIVVYPSIVPMHPKGNHLA